MQRVYVDANVVIYSIGREHPLRKPCAAFLELAAHAGACFTSSEVFQEILNVLCRRGQIEAARRALRCFDETLNSRIEPVTREDVLRAAEFNLPPALQARDRVHLAVMERLGVTRIVTTDCDFDAISGIERLDPGSLASWRDSVFATGA